MPTLAQVIAKINNDIIPNGNEEITGIILNSVLLDMVAQINDLVGELDDLNTDDATSIVNAINSLKQELDNFINSQTGALTGIYDPNEEEPIGFDGRIGTIYIQNGVFGFNIMPLSYWIYTGINDIGWLNLTAHNTFKMVVVDHYTDLPAQGQTNRIYFVQDESNTYIWNVNIFPNDYVLVGGVIEGEYIDDTTFNDEFGNPVTPNTGNLYLDTITGKYYRWDGSYFLPIDQDTGGGNLTLEQARQNGNVLEGDIDFGNVDDYLERKLTATDSNNTQYALSFSSERWLELSAQNADDDSYTKVLTQRSSALLEFYRINENKYSRIGVNTNGPYISDNNINAKGLVGSNEFDKQGDRKAFAQIADVEDAINDLAIPEDVSDLSDTTNLLFSGDYDDLTNKPTIPAQVNLIPGSNIDITGTYPNLTIEASGGSTAEWGEISGTLGDQADLQNVLNAKANDNAVVKLTGNQTVGGTKTFSTSPVVPSKSSAAANTPTAIATEAQVFLKANDADVVKITGNQTIAGVKTFSSFPITPSSPPTTDYQTPNKKYVDDKVAEMVLEWSTDEW